MTLSPTIIQALANLKIETLNPMQEASIDAWKEGKDLILLSPTLGYFFTKSRKCFLT